MNISRIQIIYALLAFLAAEAIQSIVVMGFGAFFLPMNQDTGYLISVIAVLLCGITFFFWYRYEIRGEAGGSIRRTFTVRIVFPFILLGLGCQFFISGIISLIKQYIPVLFQGYEDQLKAITSGNIIVVLLLLVIIAPLTEELIFRGIILHKASKALPFFGANLLQALLFGLYHGNIIQGIYAAFLGFLLGMIYHKFRTIFAPMLLHVFINAGSFLLYLFPERVIVYYILVLAGGFLTVGTFALLKNSK